MAVYGSNDKAVVTMTGGTFEDCGAYPYSFDEFTVTFDSDGGSAVTAQKVLNSPAIKPADSTKNGYLLPVGIWRICSMPSTQRSLQILP